jgi:VWFA-related protein
MALKRKKLRAQAVLLLAGALLVVLLVALSQPGRAQSGGQNPSAQSQDVPDAPSSSQRPAAQPPARSDKVLLPPPPSSADSTPAGPTPDDSQPAAAPPKKPDNSNAFPFPEPAQPTGDEAQPAPPPMPPVRTVPPGTTGHESSASKQQLYKFVVTSNFVQVPVTVKDTDGRRVDGLLPTDFIVLENGKKQTMSFFTSDPFELSVAVVIDLGMSDAEVQKVNETFPALIGAFSPYDEVGLYTFSSTVSQVSDFNPPNQRLTAVLNQIKTERGRNNGVPVLSGPLASHGPTVNNIPVGSPTEPVYTPTKESRVLNDAILQAALDLRKRDKTRRKVIFVIAEGREIGSKASYSDVLKLLLAQGIEVRAVQLGSGALPVYRQIERLHLPREGYGNLLPKYASATGTGQVLTELSRNAIENAYADITSEARNQYTIGYTTRATASTAYRSIEVRVSRPGLKIYAKDGYYPTAAPR